MCNFNYKLFSSLDDIWRMNLSSQKSHKAKINKRKLRFVRKERRMEGKVSNLSQCYCKPPHDAEYI